MQIKDACGVAERYLVIEQKARWGQELESTVGMDGFKTTTKKEI